jgi:CAAX prenyl protease-like protein
MNGNSKEKSVQQSAFTRIAPFALYMAFIALDGGLRFFAENGLITISNQFISCLYPVKALSVALPLFLYRKRYTEISLRDLLRPSATLISVITGITVFVLWICMDFPLATMGHPTGFNPNLFQDHSNRVFMTVARLSGAVLVVPVMEELFWRSFLIRYVVSPDFFKVPLGLFTWPSFLITVVLFGLEHHLFLAGMMAGIAYNLLLYHTRSLAHCILAHAITNLALGIYVLSSGKWYFW